MGLGVLVIADDFTALNVALPAIEQDFDVDVGTAPVVVNAYVLASGWAWLRAAASPTCSQAAVFFIGTRDLRRLLVLRRDRPERDPC